MARAIGVSGRKCPKTGWQVNSARMLPPRGPGARTPWRTAPLPRIAQYRLLTDHQRVLAARSQAEIRGYRRGTPDMLLPTIRAPATMSTRTTTNGPISMSARRIYRPLPEPSDAGMPLSQRSLERRSAPRRRLGMIGSLGQGSLRGHEDPQLYPQF